MANGNLITADYQWQLHNTLYGRGQNSASIEFGKTVEGLGVPEAKTQDVPFNLKDGTFANPDYLPTRMITIPGIIRAANASAAMSAFKNLTLDWIPLSSDTDLAFQLPGWGKFVVNGRPRGATEDLALLRSGVIRVLLRFDCPDPEITYL